MTLEERVRREVEDLHAFFVGWFGGTLDESAFDERFVPRFSPELVFVPPAGQLLGLSELSEGIRSGHGTNPRFRVEIRNVQIHHVFEGHVVATYEEWQRNALASTPPDNGRRATVLFGVGDALLWKHIHETWVPPEEMAAGPYDF